jgi:hypothetical protein
MAYTITNREVDMLGSKMVYFGDFTITSSPQELVTGLRSVKHCTVNTNAPGDVSIILNSNNGTLNSKMGSVWTSGPSQFHGSSSFTATFMAIGN